MKKKITALLLILTVFLLPFVQVFAETTSSSGDKNLRILFTHDLHSAVLPYKTADDTGKVKVSGGFTRLQTLINQNRNDHSILLDAGDFSMGSVFNSLFETSAPELSLMSTMGYDAVTLGNHEFDYGVKALANDLTAASQHASHPAIVASNLIYGDDSDSQALKKAMKNFGFEETIIITKGDVKIGVFGLLSKDAQDYTNHEGISFSDCVESAQKSVDALKAKGADVIICLSHSGINEDPSLSEDQQLAKNVQGIDVIISGHTHSTLESPLVENNTLIVAAGAKGQYLGVLDINIDQVGKVSKTQYHLKSTNETVVEDALISSAINVYKQQVQTEVLTPLGLSFDGINIFSDITLENENEWYAYGNHRIADLITDAYIYAEKQSGKAIDVAFVCSGLIRDTVYEGDTTSAEIFNILSLGKDNDGSMGYSLIDFYLYGHELKTLCQVENAIYPIMNEIQMNFSGMRFTYNPTRLPLDRVIDVEIMDDEGNWVSVEEDKLYHVCCSEYIAEKTTLISEKTGGLISLMPRDEKGNPVEKLQSCISKDQNGQNLKEWVALAAYTGSFEKNAEGKPVLPDTYHEARVSKGAVTWSFANQFSHPSTYAWIIYAVVALILIIILLIIILIRKLVKKSTKKKSIKL